MVQKKWLIRLLRDTLKIKRMKSIYDIELQLILKEEIEEGKIKVLNSNQEYFDKIEENYPIIFNKIDWISHKPIFYEDLNQKSEIEKEVKINNFLNCIESDFLNVSDGIVIVIGDDLLECAYELQYCDFVKHHNLFFSIPEHTYILIKEIDKCINYTFESELYFG